MSYRFRILALITLAVLAVSAVGRAPQLRSISYLLESTLAGFTQRVGEGEVKARPPVNVAPPVQTDAGTKSKPIEQFTIYQDSDGEFSCRAATAAERRESNNADLKALGMRPINHLEAVDKTGTIQPAAAPNLTIVLRATTQLQQNAAASAAFTKAAQNWEAIIKSPVTIYIDVDYGATRFGQPWASGVLGATSAPGGSYPYQSVRTNLIAEANGEGNFTKQAIFNALPGTTLPTDLGDAISTDVPDPSARAIGLLPATAQSTDDAARIAFNSNFTFDFDPSDGITVGQIDFDAVATHEIGHALGFDSDAGMNIAKPSVWDLFRFRTGVTTGSFATAQRILTIGGSPDPLQFYFAPGNTELGLSTGGPTGSTTNGGDGWQSSHWKHVTGCSSSYIGIMDPAIPSGCRRVITSSDMLVLTTLGFNLTNNNPPPPPPPPPAAPANDYFANAQTISNCSGTVTGTNFSATNESGEPSHDPPDTTSLSPSHTVWYQWQASSSGSVTITTAGSDFDTILAVYTGTTVGSLSLIVFNDDVQSGVVVHSSVTFNAAAGTIYRIVVDGWGGDQGGIKLNWNGCAAPSPTPTPTPTPTSTPTPTPTPGVCPGTFIVDYPGDEADASPGDGICRTGGSNCTLRAAIQEANALTSCGTIGINLSIPAGGTIILNFALPDINHNLNLNGPGSGHQVVQRSSAAGTPDFRIFTIANNRIVSMTGLTISKGNANGFSSNGVGGGILNNGALTLNSCDVLNNAALSVGGGIDNAGPSITLNNCNIGGNSSGANGATAGIQNESGTFVMNGGSVTGNFGGGGLGLAGQATLNGVLIANNQETKSISAGGVAVFNSAVVTITNSSIVNNISNGTGGGIKNGVGTLRIFNSTISGNSSTDRGAGLASFNAVSTTLVNVTITNNRGSSIPGSGICELGGPIFLRNTIVAGNVRGSTTTVADDIAGTVNASSSYNLIGLGGSGGLTNGTNGNQTNVSNINLGSLANNGGPTLTHALLVGSPAINAGSNALAIDQNGNALTTDQRGTGFPRVLNGTVDIGAYEAGNPIDEASFFVKQHYLDFLSRQPDQSGWDFWTNQITSCGTNAQCREVRRIDVSASFFLSIEFQNNGYLVERFYKVAYGNATENSTFGGAHTLNVPVVRFNEFLQGVQRIGQGVIVLQPGWEQLMESNKQAFALEFVQTSRLTTAFPTTMTPAQFVDRLNQNAGNVLSASERTTAINLFGSATDTSNNTARAQAVRQVAEDTDLYNAEYNRAFVLAEYFGYLRRNPNDAPDSDYTGYDFWLTKLNQFNGNYINAEMVKAFLSSIEYRQRFGP